MEIPIRKKQSSSRLAFTLIEMLVVVVIIALLASLIIPTVGKSLSRARSISCLSNLRQMGLAFTMYLADNKGVYPSAEGDDNNPWFVEISPYLQEEAQGAGDLSSVYRCPEYARLRPELQDTSSWLQLGYGMNYFLAGSPTQGWPFQGPATRYRYYQDQIENPTLTILLADESGWGWGIHGQNYNSQLSDNGYFGAESGRLRGGRHGKHANFLIADGHVTSLNPNTIEPFLLQ